MKDPNDKYIKYSVSTITTSLLERARTGNQEAWSIIVFLYGPLVYRWCRSDGLPEESARDVSQEVFGAIAVSLKTFDRDHDSDTFRGWLRGTCNHKIADYWRKQYRRPDPVSKDDPHPSLAQVPFRESVNDDSGVEESNLIFERILEYGKARVNPEHWEIFWKVVIDREDRHDIAAAHGMKRANIDLIVARVLARLRETFGNAFERRNGPDPRRSPDEDGANHDPG